MKEMRAKYEFALEMVRSVSKMLKERRRDGFEVTEKALNDFVTSADKASEMMIRTLIRKSYPDDEILGEEFGGEMSTSCLWIIDPIDGTVDFLNGFPCYTVSVAYYEGGQCQFGLVSVPEHSEIYSAIRGEGACLNGKKIKVSSMDVRKALAIAVPPHRRHEYLDAYLSQMRRLYDIYSDMRSIGSAALSLCYVASSRASCYYERFLHIYDVAAGVLIAMEAGAEIETRQSGEYIDIIATSKGLLARTKEAIDA